MDNKVVAQRIRSTRRALDLSGSEVASQLGISAQYYYNIENGRRNLSASKATELAKLFNVSADYLLGLSDESTGEKKATVSEKESDYLYSELYDSIRHIAKGSVEHPYIPEKNKKILREELSKLQQKYELGSYEYNTPDDIMQIAYEQSNDVFTEELTAVIETVNERATSMNDEEIPEWATSKDKRDFKKMLEEDEPVMFDGVPISEEDKEKIKRVMEAMFWDAKEKNKKTYGRKKKGD